MSLLSTAIALVGVAAPFGARAVTETVGPTGTAPVERVFGVRPGSPPQELQAIAARQGVDCRIGVPVPGRDAARPSIPLVCASVPHPALAAMSGTYWYEQDRLARAFVVDATPSQEMSFYRRRFDGLGGWLTGVLGPPTTPVELPPGWGGARPLPDAQQLALLLAGRARLSMTWQWPDAIVSLWLAGENGRVVVVIGLYGRGAPAAPAPVAAASAARPPAPAASCTTEAINDALLDLFPPAAPAARAGAATLLSTCRVSRAEGALGATLAHDPAPEVQARALDALDALGKAPSAPELARIETASAPALADAAREILARNHRPPTAAPAPATTAAATSDGALYGPPAPAASNAAPVGAPPSPKLDAIASGDGAPTAGATPMLPAPVAAPPEPSGPLPGTPLAIGASTVAGAALMRNIGAMGGLSSATPQLLLGSAGAVIGFGTSWGLSRFGVRPTIEQAAWYTNTTAWGTLVGLEAWNVSGSSKPLLTYGLPAAGEAVGMGLGVWSARKWPFTGPELVLSDSFVFGAGLSSLGFKLMRTGSPTLSTPEVVATPFVMAGAAIASRYLEPTTNDVHLMLASAGGLGWSGGLLAAGALDGGFLGSHQSWGGVSAGLGVGYLAGAALGPFVETDDRRLALAGAGLLAGNALGLGLHVTAQGFSHASGPGVMFSPAEVDARALTAGLGGLVLAGAGYAYEPYLRPGPSAASLTITGTLYGAGAWWLASAASYHGQSLGAADDARLYGGLLTGATLGGMTGLVASRWFAPSGQEQAFAAASAGLGLAGGLGVAKLVTDNQGTPDAVGVLLGTGVGLAAGARLAPGLELRVPDYGAGLLGLGTGLLVGTLAPTLGASSFEDSRQVTGAQWLGLSLGTTAGLATAHLTHATGGEVGVTAVAGVLGLGMGAGLGFVAPCGSSPCTSQGPRIGTALGPLVLMGGAMALEPHLHLASTLGPDATTLALMGGGFGFADGLMLAGALSPTGVVSGAPARQAWGGILLGSSTEVAAGLVASKYLRLRDGDALVVVTGKLTGGMFGLGAALLAKDRGDTAETLATLTGSVAGSAAAAIAQTYTPLDRTDALGAASGAGFGAFVGALTPTLGQSRWTGLDTRDSGGGLLLGLSAGAIAGAASSHASDATSRGVGLATLGGLDGLAAGLGVGLLFHDDTSSRPERLGLVVGTTGGLAVGALAWPRLRLDDGDVALTAAATGLGGWTGYWAAALGHANSNDISATTRWGGVLAGAGLSSIGASLLTPALTVDTDLVANAVALDALWSGAGAGAGALLSARDDAPVWGLLVGGTAGLVLGGALHDAIELKEADAPLLAFGGGQGAWLGGWVPMLLHADASVSARQRAGALALGGFGGLGLTTLLSPVIHPETDAIENASTLEGVWAGAGAGAGALVSTQANAPVWGLLGAGTAGMLLGGALHDQITIGPAQAPLLGFAGAEGLWLGGWIPSLLHANGAAPDRERLGAVALGGFGAVGTATLLSSHLSFEGDGESDAIENAAALDALWTGAGAGAGALFSTQANAPVWGMLGAGTAGMLLGGGLHREITLDAADAPLLTLAGGEGLWLGAWVPYLLHDSAHVTGREQLGALALGGFGGLGTATLASAGFELSPARGAFGATGSAIGASIGGGLALMTPSLHGQGGVGLMLAGTTVGLASGLVLGPGFQGQAPERLVGAAALGAGLGVSESLLFAWSGRASGGAQFGGAALTGAGVGSALGLAVALTPPGEKSASPAAAGFAAWGAWSGAFAGSLFANDPHDDVMGGLIGANIGFLTGYALLRNDVVEPRDFGWLSLFGALGTVAGAGVAAPFSNGSTTPVRAGLAIGPVAGMITGALVLPTLRKVIAPATTAPKATASERRAVALAMNDAETSPDVATSDAPAGEGAAAAARHAHAEPATAPSTLARRLSQVGGVTDWQPLVGALPAPAEQGPTPLLFGVTGHWR